MCFIFGNCLSLPKIVKCALTLCHSNADVERSLSVNKRTLTNQNMAMKDETLIGLRVIKDTIKHAGGITKVEVSLNMIKAAEKSRSLYHKHLKEEIDRINCEKNKVENELFKLTSVEKPKV